MLLGFRRLWHTLESYQLVLNGILGYTYEDVKKYTPRNVLFASGFSGKTIFGIGHMRSSGFIFGDVGSMVGLLIPKSIAIVIAICAS